MTDTVSRRINWSKLGLESVAVLLSILAALAIDASWARYQAGLEERATLERVLAEFEANRTELEFVGSSHQRVHDFGLGLLEVAYGRSDLSDDSARHLRILLGMSIYYDPSTGALAGFLGGDQPGLVADPELTDRIAGFPAKVDELWQQQGLLRELIAESIQPYVVESSDRLLALPPALSSESMHELRSRLFGPEDDARLLELLSDAELRNLIAARVMLEGESLQKHEQLTIEFDAIEQGLRQALGQGSS